MSKKLSGLKKYMNHLSLERLKLPTILKLNRSLKTNRATSFIVLKRYKTKKQKSINFKHRSRTKNFKALNKRRFNLNNRIKLLRLKRQLIQFKIKHKLLYLTLKLQRYKNKKIWKVMVMILVISQQIITRDQTKKFRRRCSHRTILMNQTGSIKMKFGDKLGMMLIINLLRRSMMILEISVILMRLSHQVTCMWILQLRTRNQKKRKISETSMTIQYNRRALSQINLVLQWQKILQS